MIKIVSREDYYESGKAIMLRGLTYEVEDLGDAYRIEIYDEVYKVEKCQVYTMDTWRDKQLNVILND